MEKHKVDGDLKKIQGFRAGAKKLSRGLASLGLSVVFLVAVLLYAGFHEGTVGTGAFVVAAAVVAACMVMHLGASDLANNIGPAVGARVFTATGALLIAIAFEIAGLVIAGGDVISTIHNGIIGPAVIADQMTVICIMMSALIAAALWHNLATWIGAPVSAAHSIVGGAVGAGIAAAGASSLAWGTLGTLAVSWLISPVLGGVIAAALVYFVTHKILFQEDKLEAARTWVPVLVGVMAGAFSMYLAMKGLDESWKPDVALVWLIAAGGFAVTWTITKPFVAKATVGLENRKGSVAKLFTIPLVG
ncbi:MAG: inorganic phosphate transporter, partial [Kordiimonas sp.]